MLKLLPYPRSLKVKAGTLTLPGRMPLRLDPNLPRETTLLPVFARLAQGAAPAGVELELVLDSGKLTHPHIEAKLTDAMPKKPSAYTLNISRAGIKIGYWEENGLRAAVATLRQLIREYGSTLPLLAIKDHADFTQRGVMLDVSRGRVPTLATLFELASHLADLKINEFQLYTEHTFAYRNYEPVWKNWGALTAGEILKLDDHCRKLGIELVPNQNSFGHLRYWLAYPPLKKLAEIDHAYPDQNGAFLRQPTTLAPNHPGTIPFLKGLYDELLPCFTSKKFNVGCDETWDLGRGQSQALCGQRGKGRVYLDFLKQIQREVKARGKQMLFWGDIILHYPELVAELPKDVVALNWGYEASHPFDAEAAVFAKSKVPFYTCPGTCTWMTLIGRLDNALINLKSAAIAGKKHGALGYLNTDWGDGGHLHPLAISYLPYLAGAAAGWCSSVYDEQLLVPVANRDIFEDPTGNSGKAARALGLAHRKFKYTAPNVTPFGTAITAPPPAMRELFCRDGLKYYARIPKKNILAAQKEVAAQRKLLAQARPASKAGMILREELDLAARMAEQSCKLMLWQQALAAGQKSIARRQAVQNSRELKAIDRDFSAYWPRRNKGDARTYWPFADWRLREYRQAKLFYPPKVAAPNIRSTTAD